MLHYSFHYFRHYPVEQYVVGTVVDVDFHIIPESDGALVELVGAKVSQGSVSHKSTNILKFLNQNI